MYRIVALPRRLHHILRSIILFMNLFPCGTDQDFADVRITYNPVKHNSRRSCTTVKTGILAAFCCGSACKQCVQHIYTSNMTTLTYSVPHRDYVRGTSKNIQFSLRPAAS